MRWCGVRRWAGVVAVCMLSLSLLAGSATAKPQSKRGLFWGAWIGNQLTGTQPPWDMAAVSNFAARFGKGLSTIQFGVPFADCSVSPCSFYDFPTKEMESIRGYGAIPFLSWSSQATPWIMGQPEPDFQLGDVIAGTYDSYIREFAAAARAWGHPYFMRFNWEPNGDWFPWGEAANGNQPGEFVAAWRHVHDIFTAAGATNTTWVWCPYIDIGKFAPIANFYPGDEYVDWSCLDGYNWAKARSNPVAWKSFDEIFASSYHQIVDRIAPTKPMLLAEIASSGGGKAKADWIREMFSSLRTKFRRIRGLIWFDQVQQGVSWPLENSPIVTRAFASGLSQHPFRANKFGTLSATPIPPPR